MEADYYITGYVREFVRKKKIFFSLVYLRLLKNRKSNKMLSIQKLDT